MTDYDNTLFQELINNREVEQMLNDLQNLTDLVPDQEDPEDVDSWELRISFTRGEVDRMIEELEELTDGDQ